MKMTALKHPYLSRFAHACLAGVVATLILVTPAQAVPVPGQGTWDNPDPAIGLQARDLDGDTWTDAFYDPALNITWLRHSGTRKLGWAEAVAWAANFSIGIYDDWRLPTMVDIGEPGCNMDVFFGGDCFFYPLTTKDGKVYSEMASLWYDTLGNIAECTTDRCSHHGQIGLGLTNTGDFENLQPYCYWSGLAIDIPGIHGGWYFFFDVGRQVNFNQSWTCYTLAVRPGDVAGNQVVPEPGTVVLVLTALACLYLTRRPRPVRYSALCTTSTAHPNGASKAFKSSSLNLMAEALSKPSTPSVRACLRACNSSMRSSMLPSTTSW
jgi:hypothetical protein